MTLVGVVRQARTSVVCLCYSMNLPRRGHRAQPPVMKHLFLGLRLKLVYLYRSEVRGQGMDAINKDMHSYVFPSVCQHMCISSFKFNLFLGNLSGSIISFAETVIRVCDKQFSKSPKRLLCSMRSECITVAFVSILVICIWVFVHLLLGMWLYFCACVSCDESCGRLFTEVSQGVGLELYGKYTQTSCGCKHVEAFPPTAIPAQELHLIKRTVSLYPQRFLTKLNYSFAPVNEGGDADREICNSSYSELQLYKYGNMMGGFEWDRDAAVTAGLLMDLGSFLTLS